MLVFISWSGQRSKIVAEALENWLAQVIQAVEPWVSQDINKGLRWSVEVADRLERSKVGIICLTKSNLNAKWIHFEAGALSKFKDAYVCTLLLDIKPAEVEQPLAQFQHTTMEKEQIFKLLNTINGAVATLGEKALTEARLRDVFETYWPRLEEVFQESATLQETIASTSRSEGEILHEVLEILRNRERRQNLAMAEEMHSHSLHDVGRGSFGDRGPRQMVEVDCVCYCCGKSITELPFPPSDPDNVLCRDCHMANRPERSDRGFGRSRGPRAMHKGNYVCSGCGAAITELPFRPSPNRPIRCRACHAADRALRPGFGGGRY